MNLYAMLYQLSDGTLEHSERCKSVECAVKLINPLTDGGKTLLGHSVLYPNPSSALMWMHRQVGSADRAAECPAEYLASDAEAFQPKMTPADAAQKLPAKIRALIAILSVKPDMLTDESRWILREAAYHLGNLSAPAAQAAPAGMVLVPREPTREMCLAARRETAEYLVREDADSPVVIYRAMLAAAPAAQVAVPDKVTGWRMIDGVRVYSVQPSSPFNDPIEFVLRSDYDAKAVTPVAAYAVPTGETSESGLPTYTLHDEPVPMADNVTLSAAPAVVVDDAMVEIPLGAWLDGDITPDPSEADETGSTIGLALYLAAPTDGGPNVRQGRYDHALRTFIDSTTATSIEPDLWSIPAAAPAAQVAHTDDIAVDKFAAAMKEKLAAARAKGRGGWDDSEDLQQHLSNLLRAHVEKGDPRDVANFCCFLWNRGEAICAAPAAQVAVTGWSAEDACEAFIAAEVDAAPEALRRLGDWLCNVLDEDRQKTASAMVLGAMMETSAAIRAVSAAAPAVVVDEARPRSEYHEDMGPVVWWAFPVNEPSWIGTPNDDDWPGYHTHWTPHPRVPVPAAALNQGKANG